MRLTPLLCLLAAPSFAEDVGIPVGSKIVTFDLPDGFVQSFEDETDRAFIRGYVPEGAADDELLTLTVTRNLAGLPDLSLLDFVNFGLGALKAQCAGTFAQEVISPDYTIAERPALGVFVSCTNRSGKPDGESQGTVFIAFRGPTDFYALQWSVDGPPLEATPAYDAALWQDKVDRLVNSARLCELAEPVVPCKVK